MLRGTGPVVSGYRYLATCDRTELPMDIRAITITLSCPNPEDCNEENLDRVAFEAIKALVGKSAESYALDDFKRDDFDPSLVLLTFVAP